ncbi:MAG: 30S ribosomal protein S16 [Prevotellaceae bacterium]|nr:30S ribosomal protein S16 [Prevotellaceae bacterium]
MSVKIRLARHGKKGYAFYHINATDSRAPRDGRFIEKLGIYNPNTNPATIDLNFERALYWVETGAQPTDTARMLLKTIGVYLMVHLKGGVKKGAFDEAEAQKRFDAWKANKEQALNAVVAKDAEKKNAIKKAGLEAEKKVNATIAAKVAEKKAAAIAAAQPAVEEAPAEQPEETPAE